jgi:hypothetical protein
MPWWQRPTYHGSPALVPLTTSYGLIIKREGGSIRRTDWLLQNCRVTRNASVKNSSYVGYQHALVVLQSSHTRTVYRQFFFHRPNYNNHSQPETDGLLRGSLLHLRLNCLCTVTTKFFSWKLTQTTTLLNTPPFLTLTKVSQPSGQTVQ